MEARPIHVFSQIYIHLNWHCKDSLPMIHKELEPRLYAFIQEYCAEDDGIHFLQVGGTETHVHLLIRIEPHAHLAEWVGKVKGASAYTMNKQFGPKSIQWQRGYGALSFAKSDSDALVRYVRSQKEIHKSRKLNVLLEKFDG